MKGPIPGPDVCLERIRPEREGGMEVSSMITPICCPKKKKKKPNQT